MRKPPSVFFLSNNTKTLRAALCLLAIGVFDLTNTTSLGWTLGNPNVFFGVVTAVIFTSLSASVGHVLIMAAKSLPRFAIVACVSFGLSLLLSPGPTLTYRIAAPFVVAIATFFH